MEGLDVAPPLARVMKTAIFHWFGKIFSVIQQLMMSVSTVIINGKVSLSISIQILSFPVDLQRSIFPILSIISCGRMGGMIAVSLNTFGSG